MINTLIKLELVKVKNYPTFWAIAIIHAILFMMVMLIGANIDFEVQGINMLDFFKPKYLWGTTAWIASWFNLILGVLVIILVGNELQFGTIKSQLIAGMSRNGFVAAKFLLISALTLYVLILVFITGICAAALSPHELSNGLFINFKAVFILGIQAFSYMAIAFLFALLFKGNGISTILYILYFILIEPIIRIFVPSPADYYFPIKTISNLTPMPNFLEMLSENYGQLQGIENLDPNTTIQLHNISQGPSLTVNIIVTIAYAAAIIGTIYILVRKKDY